MEAVTDLLGAVGDDLERFWPFLTILGGLAGAAAVGVAGPILQQDKSFEQIRDWAVKPGPAARYRDLIGYGLDAAARFYGPAPWLSWRGYVRCLLVACVYPIFLWILAWALHGPGTFAGARASFLSACRAS